MSIESPQIPQVSRMRVGWEEAIEQVLAEHGHEQLDGEWLDLPLGSEEVLEW